MSALDEPLTYEGHPVMGMADGGVLLCNWCWSVGTKPITEVDFPHGFKCERCWHRIKTNGDRR